MNKAFVAFDPVLILLSFFLSNGNDELCCAYLYTFCNKIFVNCLFFYLFFERTIEATEQKRFDCVIST